MLTHNDNQDISVDGHAIERMGEIKLLGVQIDEKLSFTSHVSELCTKASRMAYRIRPLVPQTPPHQCQSPHSSRVLFFAIH